MRRENNQLSIIVPIFNEFKIVENFLVSLQHVFKNIKCKYIIIDDGSTDGSIQIVQKTLKIYFKNKDVKYIKLNRNFGKTRAIKEGIKFIDSKYTLLIDSDLEYSPNDALELYQIVKKNKLISVIQGSRYLGAKVQLRRYIFNDIAVRINTFLFNFLFRQSITDLHTGTKIIKSNLLKSLNLSYSRFGLEINLNTQIAKKNINIFEYGIGYIERSKEDGKKITLIDGLFSYYYLFISRFIQNDLPTNISIWYSFISMIFIGTFFGLGLGKILITIIFGITGLMLGVNRKIIPLSIIFFSIYLGSLFSQGNGRIVPIVLFYLASLYISNKISKKYSKIKKNNLTRFLV